MVLSFARGCALKAWFKINSNISLVQVCMQVSEKGGINAQVRDLVGDQIAELQASLTPGSLISHIRNQVAELAAREPQSVLLCPDYVVRHCPLDPVCERVGQDGVLPRNLQIVLQLGLRP